MSGKQIITDWLMVPLVLVVLVGGFAMNIKAVENKNADLSQKLDAVQAALSELKQAHEKLGVRAAPAKPADKTNDAAKTPAKQPADTPDKPAANPPKQPDDDSPADVPL